MSPDDRSAARHHPGRPREDRRRPHLQRLSRSRPARPRPRQGGTAASATRSRSRTRASGPMDDLAVEADGLTVVVDARERHRPRRRHDRARCRPSPVAACGSRTRTRAGRTRSRAPSRTCSTGRSTPGVGTHGGMVTLVEVKDGTAFMRFGGGCQGCAAVDVTLKQGVETAVRDAVPAIRRSSTSPTTRPARTPTTSTGPLRALGSREEGPRAVRARWSACLAEAGEVAAARDGHDGGGDAEDAQRRRRRRRPRGNGRFVCCASVLAPVEHGAAGMGRCVGRSPVTVARMGPTRQ